MDPKTIQIAVWSFLGLGVLLSYVLLVLQFYPKTSSLWYNTPKWIQYTAYCFWLLAAVGAVSYAVMAPYNVWRFWSIALLLIASSVWSLCMIYNWNKWCTVGVLIFVALCCLAAIANDALVEKQWLLVVCLLPLFFVNAVVDGGIWNYYYLQKQN